MVQSAAAHLVFNQPKRAHVPLLFIDLRWLPMPVQIKFTSLLPASRPTSGSAPIHLNSITRAYAPPRATAILQDTSSGLAIPAQKTLTIQTVFINGSLMARSLPFLTPRTPLLARKLCPFSTDLLALCVIEQILHLGLNSRYLTVSTL